MRYEFGKNWEEFLKTSFTEERVSLSREHLLNKLRLTSLEGKSFLDIGCGSGLHSLAALLSGADQITSIDIDPDSVAATRKLWYSVGEPGNWKIIEGSILDEEFTAKLPVSDIVYSWGVLHHTGDMLQALKNVTIPLASNGVLYIALYSYEMYNNPSPEYWLDIKKKYNTTDNKEEMEYDYAWNHVLKPVADQGDNPLVYMRDYKKNRGMEFWTDVRDWLGGYPMEFAKVRDVAQLYYHEFKLEMLDVITGEGNTEFLLRPANSSNYWDSIVNQFSDIELSEPISHDEGYCYRVDMSGYSDIADNDSRDYYSPLLIIEDGVVLGFPHARFKTIKEQGEGRFCHWKEALLFSASDNSDPNANGRKYCIRVPKKYGDVIS